MAGSYGFGRSCANVRERCGPEGCRVTIRTGCAMVRVSRGAMRTIAGRRCDLRGTIVIERRFRGPPNSGNGGYSCGRLAAFVDGTAEVTLVKPPPLDTPLSVADEADGTVALYDGERLIATARATTVDVEARTRPTFAEAEAAARRTFPASAHKLPMCFVCGPDREP